MMIIRDLIQQATNQFFGSDTAKLDAQLLLGQVLDKDRTWLMTWDDIEVSEGDRQCFEQLVARRVRGEPIAHILGYREFWGLKLACDASTLIPRPETELLVEKALELNLPRDARVLDLGTGTGAIALALANERSGWKVVATDFSAAALALAERNKQSLGIRNIELIQSDWFGALEPRHQFDLIVSNPPYVHPDSPYLNKGDVRFEPQTALIAANAGLADIETIAQNAPGYLKRGGWLLVEHGYDQAGLVAETFRKSGFTAIQNFKDLAGWPRVTCGQIG